MDFSQSVVFFGVILLAAAVIAYVKTRIEDHINEFRLQSEARDTSLAKKIVEAKTIREEMEHRIFVKLETCYQLAHQASVAVKNLNEFDGTKPIHLTLDPLRVTLDKPIVKDARKPLRKPKPRFKIQPERR